MLKSTLRIANPFLLAERILLAAAALVFALYFLHLNADQPSFTHWIDWAKYTDEGWYSSAAIRQVLFHRWFYPGDFNPAVALPIWPLVEYPIFRIFGVSAAAARALTVVIFGLTLVAVYFLLRNTRPESVQPENVAPARRTLAPSITVLLLVVNPLCYAFYRLAILEPLLILLTLCALIAAQRAPGSRRWQIALGFLFPLAILTKTTTTFLVPALLHMLFASAGHRMRAFLRAAAIPVALGATLWLAYMLLVILSHHLVDYRYLFSANAYTGITADKTADTIHATFADGVWIGPILYPLAFACFAVSILFARRLWPRNPLAASLTFWIAGYLVFLAWHAKLQPRYYLVIAVPLTMLFAQAAGDMLAKLDPRRIVASVPAAATVVALLAIVVPMARETLHDMRAPQYTLQRAALGVRDIINANPTHPRLLLSSSSDDITLFTGLQGICDQFGTAPLTQRIAVYRPGWYGAWNTAEDEKMDALAPLYRVTRVAEFDVMDDPTRDQLILYRLDPLETLPTPTPPHRHRPIPRRMQTRIGQQPSQKQLQH